MHKVFFVLFVSLVWMSWGQLEQPTKKINIQSFAYPDFGGISKYSGFEALYPLGKTFVVLRGLNQQNAAFRRFNARIAIKQRLTKKLSGVAGYETEFNLADPGWSSDPSKSIYLGLEYEPDPNLSVNGGLRTFLNSPNFNPLGTEKSNAKTMWSFGSKLKF